MNRSRTRVIIASGLLVSQSLIGSWAGSSDVRWGARCHGENVQPAARACVADRRITEHVYGMAARDEAPGDAELGWQRAAALPHRHQEATRQAVMRFLLVGALDGGRTPSTSRRMMDSTRARTAPGRVAGASRRSRPWRRTGRGRAPRDVRPGTRPTHGANVRSIQPRWLSRASRRAGDRPVRRGPRARGCARSRRPSSRSGRRGGARRSRVAGLGGAGVLLDRALPRDDRHREIVLGTEVAHDRLAADAGGGGDGVERHLVVRAIEPVS